MPGLQMFFDFFWAHAGANNAMGGRFCRLSVSSSVILTKLRVFCLKDDRMIGLCYRAVAVGCYIYFSGDGKLHGSKALGARRRAYMHFTLMVHLVECLLYDYPFT